MSMDGFVPVRNVTQVATQFAGSSVGQLARIEGLVTVSCFLVIILVFSSSRRRHQSNAVVSLVVWAAFMFNYPVISYTVGLMQSSSVRNELFVVWACFLLLLLGSADAMTAFSFNDSQQRARSMMNQALHIMYLLFLILYYKAQLRMNLMAPLFVLWSLSVVQLVLRVNAYRTTSRASGLIRENQIVYEYMKHELMDGSNNVVVGKHDPDPSSMKAYNNYLVDGGREEETTTAAAAAAMVSGGGVRVTRTHVAADTVSVDKVWECKGKLLGSGSRGAARRRDLCLSFALFRLLRLRFGADHVGDLNFHSYNDLSKSLVIGRLLSDDQDLDRAFRVVEAELGFLFDFFYARYPSFKDSIVLDLILYLLIMATSLFTLFSSVLLHYRPSTSSRVNIIIHSFNLDLFVTRVVVSLYIFLESYQFLSLMLSDWHKVKMMCHYVLKSSWHRASVEIPMKLLCRLNVSRYWKNTINQYFLLDTSVGSSSSSLLSTLTLQLLDPWIMTSSVVLPPEVKQAVLVALKDSDGKITDGREWLHQNDVLDGDLDYDLFSRKTYAPYIMAWHVATSICSYKHSKSDMTTLQASPEFRYHYQVATKLSGYCAYLVAFAPELLPDGTYTSQLLSRHMLESAHRYLAGCKSSSDKYDRLTTLGRHGWQQEKEEGHPLLYEGAVLARNLMYRKKDALERWKVLAGFWANLVLYIAPSDRASAHASKLATGGELVTIIWALLNHAGVVHKLQENGGCQPLEMPPRLQRTPVFRPQENDSMV
ncbi:hypothetical protein GUJ93_ZPchr0002g23420 [Zizania palustris]|uniref:DUF4220 domain-containing protein n=1 Tax=Zizania palustris TaxID=103762 RepID=A0A8J5SFK9_ZIZPA|nr:hypothetical protein GUJ93_ZPchr0002g23420 [Zizania palustris]